MVSSHTIQFKLGTYRTHGTTHATVTGRQTYKASKGDGNCYSIILLALGGVSVLVSALNTATVDIKLPVAAASLSQLCSSQHVFCFIPMIVSSLVGESKDTPAPARKQLSHFIHPPSLERFILPIQIVFLTLIALCVLMRMYTCLFILRRFGVEECTCSISLHIQIALTFTRYLPSFLGKLSQA